MTAQPQSARRRSAGGRFLPIRFLFVGALLLVGVGVAVARETALGRSVVSADPTPSVGFAPVADTPPLAAPERPTVNTPTPLGFQPAAAVSTPRPTATGAPVRATSTALAPVAAGRAAHVATPTILARPTATAASATGPVVGVTGSTAGSSHSAAGGGAGTVALTFDAGADRGYAEDILDTLADQHVVAAFGVTGVWAKANPGLVRRMTADGHLVINHTLDHRSFTGVSDQLGGLTSARRRAELDDADAILAPLVGHSTKPFYRLPYGDDDARVAADVAADGYTRKVGWTVDSLGWRGSAATDIVARCLTLAAPGGVYVFHVGKASQDALALPSLIGSLRDRGYGFARVDAV